MSLRGQGRSEARVALVSFVGTKLQRIAVAGGTAVFTVDDDDVDCHSAVGVRAERNPVFPSVAAGGTSFMVLLDGVVAVGAERNSVIGMNHRFSPSWFGLA